MKFQLRALGAVLLLALPVPAAADEPEEPREPPSLLGPVTREQIEEAEPEWVASQAVLPAATRIIGAP